MALARAQNAGRSQDSRGAALEYVSEAARRATSYRGSLGARNPALIQPFKRPFST